MKELNLTEGPWEIERKAEVFKDNRLVADCCDYSMNNSEEYINESDANAKAIVTAVNNTYHKGIDPKAVEDMKEALMDAKEFIEALACPYIENDMELKKQVEEALQKADLNNEKGE